MPSGSLVAGFSKRALPNGINTLREIVFWERNGLRHGEFNLPFDDEIVNLDFSLDSTLLALHCISQDKKHSVQIYYRSNWKWFLKQTILLEGPLSTFKWMFNKKQQLFLIQESGRVDFVEFHLTYMTSSSNYNHAKHPDLSYTAVVDGNCINLTPLGKFVMPPPMFEKQVQLAGSSHPLSCLYMHGH